MSADEGSLPGCVSSVCKPVQSSLRAPQEGRQGSAATLCHCQVSAACGHVWNILCNAWRVLEFVRTRWICPDAHKPHPHVCLMLCGIHLRCHSACPIWCSNPMRMATYMAPWQLLRATDPIKMGRMPPSGFRSRISLWAAYMSVRGCLAGRPEQYVMWWSGGRAQPGYAWSEASSRDSILKHRGSWLLETFNLLLGKKIMWAAAEIDYQSSCQSRLSGVHLVFEVFQDIWHSNKENPGVYWGAALSCPSIASNYANSYLVSILFWMLTIPWIF